MERFIDPKTLAKVKDIPLIAKVVAEGFLFGLNQSRQRGVGLEFSQFRSYEPGDPINRIDWKLYSRCDKYFIHEAEKESEIPVWFVLDASRSMAYKLNKNNDSKKNNLNNKNIDSDHEKWTKLDYAKHLTATLAYLAQLQGDQIGLLTLSTDTTCFLPADSGINHWQKLCAKLDSLESQEFVPPVSLVERYLHYTRKPALIFFISDFFQENNEINRIIDQLKGKHNEVVALYMSSNEEKAFDFQGPNIFTDLETNEEILLDAGAAKNTYLQALSNFESSLIDLCKLKNMEYVPVVIEDALDKVCQNYLQLRQQTLRRKIG